MPILDRYIFYLFVKIFIVCFVSFAGLYIVIDAFTNLEEFLELGNGRGGFFTVLSQYYGPRILQFFDRMAPLIALIAGIFTLTLMQRTNELVAVQAAGVSKRRVARPIIITTAIVVMLAIVNRELGIPKYRIHLASNAQDWTGAKERRVQSTVDLDSEIRFHGGLAKPNEGVIQSPTVFMPADLAKLGSSISAQTARFEQRGDRKGYRLQGVQAEFDLANPPDIEANEFIVFPNTDQSLAADECFIYTELDVVQLAFGQELNQFATLGEMIHASKLPSASYSNRQRVDIHNRIVKPVFDMTILLIGLPLVVSRRERNLVLSAGICLLIVVGMSLTVMTCHALGSMRLISSPALAAWLPIIMFVPLAAATVQLLDR